MMVSARAALVRGHTPASQPAAAPPGTGGMRGLLIAGTRSGCGKTTLTLALLAALRRRGLVVQAGKHGPDFLDPTHHALFTGRPAYNLDGWMGGDAGLRRIFTRMATQLPLADVLVIEGAMGLFDGAHGLGGPGSSAHTARLLQLPILLAADVRGMSQSAAALALGYTRLLPDLHFTGIVCTHVASENHAALLRDAFHAAGIPLLGLLPRDLPPLPSRHLGLVMAQESGWTPDAQARLADWLETHMDLDALLDRLPALHFPAAQAPLVPAADDSTARTGPRQQPASPAPAKRDTATLSTLPGNVPTATAPASPATSFPSSHGTRQQASDPPARPPQRLPSLAPIRLAVARDAAFCFLYADLPDYLRERGVTPVFFSPLRDTCLPAGCAGLYFPGGYPELHARELSANRPMRQAVRAFARAGGCIYGECGGYIYLMEELELDGTAFRMTGCLPCRCRLERQRVALGYREVSPAVAGPFGTPAASPRAVPPCGRGHEYHYARLLPDPAPLRLPPLWHVRDRQGGQLPDEGVLYGSVAASWVHLYPEGARTLLRHWTHTLRQSTLRTLPPSPQEASSLNKE